MRTLPPQPPFCVNPQDPGQISVHLTKTQGRSWRNFGQGFQGPSQFHALAMDMSHISKAKPVGKETPSGKGSGKGEEESGRFTARVCPGGWHAGYFTVAQSKGGYLCTLSPRLSTQACSQPAGLLLSMGSQAWQRKWPCTSVLRE